MQPPTWAAPRATASAIVALPTGAVGASTSRGRRRQGAFALVALAAGAFAAAAPAAGGYQTLKACSLVPLEEVRKLAPWPTTVDRNAQAQEVLLPGRATCSYPTATVQVEAYRPELIESVRKSVRLEPLPGLGDEAYVGSKSKVWALVYAKVGTHLLGVEVEIPVGQTFETVKPKVIELAKAFAARLR